MKNWIMLKIWLFRYAIEMRSRSDYGFMEAWHYGESTQENFDCDLEDLDCPIDAVGEDMSYWYEL